MSTFIIEIAKTPLDSIGSADGQQQSCWIPEKSAKADFVIVAAVLTAADYPATKVAATPAKSTSVDFYILSSINIEVATGRLRRLLVQF